MVESSINLCVQMYRSVEPLSIRGYNARQAGGERNKRKTKKDRGKKGIATGKELITDVSDASGFL